jgi:hypothetical protein
MPLVLVLLLLSLSACTPFAILGDTPRVEEAPAPDLTPPVPVTPPALTVPPVVEPTLVSFPPLSRQDAPQTALEPPAPPAPLPKGKKRAGGGPTRPDEVIEQAQRAARVAPTARGYFGNSAVQRFLWQPGRLYDVRVSPQGATKFVLPPGQLLAVGVALDPNAWDVTSATVGSETRAYSVVFIRPCDPHTTEECRAPEKGAVNVSLVTEQGYSFDVHLIIDATREPMFAVTWELPVLQQFIVDDTPLNSPAR